MLVVRLQMPCKLCCPSSHLITLISRHDRGHLLSQPEGTRDGNRDYFVLFFWGSSELLTLGNTVRCRAVLGPLDRFADFFRAVSKKLTLLCAGPITGGFLGDAAGFRWVQGMLALFSGSLTILGCK